jgi:translation initiation factor 2B subunit (eIF-2B alpha/beta/delta family)
MMVGAEAIMPDGSAVCKVGTIHPAVKTVVEHIHADAIGGAADIAREVVDALAAA